MKKQVPKTTQPSKPAPSSKATTPTAPAGRPIGPLLALIGLIAVLFFVFIVRYRLLEFPLERDEGEYALMGQLILKGIPPYELAYNMKLPGTYYMYALLMKMFGQTVAGVHAGLLLINLISVTMLFFIGKKLGSATLGFYAAATYALLSVSPTLLGFAAHATHFIVLFGLVGLLALLAYAERRNMAYLVLSGLGFGLSFVMKQQAVFLLMFGGLAYIILALQQKPFKPWKSILGLGLIGASMLAPYGLVLLNVKMNGTFDQFWHWTVEYAREYTSLRSNKENFDKFTGMLKIVTRGMVAFWVVGTFGFLVLFFTKTTKPYRWLILLFSVFSFACIVPGFYFRSHYFIVLLPALALLLGVTMTFLQEQFLKTEFGWIGVVPTLAFVLLFYFGIDHYRNFLFSTPPQQLCREIYSPSNPFIESLEIAKFLKSNTKEQDKVIVIGSEPQIYFYANRLPASGFIYTYPLTENQPYSKEMRREMIAEIEKNEPKYMVFINSSYSWGGSSEAVKDYLDWYVDYQKYYTMVGLVDINPTGKATYVWGEASKTYKAVNETKIWIHQRKPVESAPGDKKPGQ